MNGRRASGLPEAEIRRRARAGAAEVFPPSDRYGRDMFGAVASGAGPWDHLADRLDNARLVPPVFMPERLKKLIELGREPLFDDVVLTTEVGGFSSQLPLFLSAFGSTDLSDQAIGLAAARQAGRLGIPMVVGENVVPVRGYGDADRVGSTLLDRIDAYFDAAPDGVGGLVVQQSTEDADAEVWNMVYSDPSLEALLQSGRLGLELKVGQGAKPGLGGMTVVDRATAHRLADRYTISDVFGDPATLLRSSSPGTFTDEILRQQIRLMRNNYPRAKVWVKLPPGRDVADACDVAWNAGADAVTVDGAEGGTGWAPRVFLQHVGLPLFECLTRIDDPAGCLLVTGRMWEGSRVVKSLALGARAAGLGRAALVAVDEDPEHGLMRLVEAIALECCLLISALGKYSPDVLDVSDLWVSDAQRR